MYTFKIQQLLSKQGIILLPNIDGVFNFQMSLKGTGLLYVLDFRYFLTFVSKNKISTFSLK